MVILKGTITSGLGKAAGFMAMDYYKEQSHEKLGFIPYEGTLNVIVEKKYVNAVKNLEPIRIKALEKGSKKYSGANCYKINILGIKGTIIVPDITEHGENIMEIIAPVNLKSELNLKDGDKINIDLEK